MNLLSFPTETKPDTERYQSLLTYLDELLSVKEEQSAEIVKFLQAILDKLIDILLDLKTKQPISAPAAATANASNSTDTTKAAYEMHARQIQPRVFEILVAIFQIIENQSKFASFRTVIDAYLSKNFCITLAHKPLLRIFMETMTSIYDKYAAYNQSTTPQIQSNGSSSSLLLNTTTGSATKTTTTTTTTTNGGNRFSESYSMNGGGGHQGPQSSSSLSYPQNHHHHHNNEEKDNEKAINTIKSMEYIFKFAFRSRELLSLYNRYDY